MSTQKSMKLSLVDAFLSALVIGAGETYLPAYALSTGMGEVFAGILATLPIVSGAFLQLMTPRGLQQVQSHKHWVVISTILQALTFLPLVYFSATRSPDFWTLFLILSLYWGAGFSSGIAWNYWMGRLVPPDEGTRFFSKRARISQIGILTGLIGGGLALHFNVALGPFSSVFTFLFLFAGACRLMCSYVQSSQFFDPEWKKDPRLSFRQSLKVFLKNKEKRKFFFLLAPFQAAVFVSSPFVTPYMLAQVKMNYGKYMVAIAMFFAGKVLTLLILENFKKPSSGFQLLLFGAAFIVPLPAFWVVGTSQEVIYMIQVASGLGWACIEVGLSLIFFKDLKHQEKVPVLTVYNLLNSLAIIFGTYIGGKCLWYMGENKQGYDAVFILGSVARLVGFFPLYLYARSQFAVKSNPLIQLEKAS